MSACGGFHPRQVLAPRDADAILASCWARDSADCPARQQHHDPVCELIGAGEMISIATTALQDMAQALLILLRLSHRPHRQTPDDHPRHADGHGGVFFSMAAPGFGPAAGLALLLALSVFAVTIGACNSA